LTLKEHNEIGPVFYRICAAERGRALGPDELAQRAGLSRSSIQRISAKLTWDGITMGVASRFVTACGFTFGSHKEINKRLKLLHEHGLRGLRHLNVKKTAPLWKLGANGNRLKFISRSITQPVCKTCGFRHSDDCATI